MAIAYKFHKFNEPQARVNIEARAFAFVLLSGNSFVRSLNLNNEQKPHKQKKNA